MGSLKGASYLATRRKLPKKVKDRKESRYNSG
jgi:hypothetical protein